ncbi:hypothetical protein [Demequina sp. NBRC 110057]|uniref:hypothetical protein n=1 Tax=Demequina sp. NBRC 110057 TaxID=1570346 RepID=UPI000A06D4E2|nr:hypothetical protein [Demequina sp. NBRC 110057]
MQQFSYAALKGVVSVLLAGVLTSVLVLLAVVEDQPLVLFAVALVWAMVALRLIAPFRRASASRHDVCEPGWDYEVWGPAARAYDAAVPFGGAAGAVMRRSTIPVAIDDETVLCERVDLPSGVVVGADIFVECVHLPYRFPTTVFDWVPRRASSSTDDLVAQLSVGLEAAVRGEDVMFAHQWMTSEVKETLTEIFEFAPHVALSGATLSVWGHKRGVPDPRLQELLLRLAVTLRPGLVKEYGSPVTAPVPPAGARHHGTTTLPAVAAMSLVVAPVAAVVLGLTSIPAYPTRRWAQALLVLAIVGGTAGTALMLGLVG